jgi:hypothetical protein
LWVAESSHSVIGQFAPILAVPRPLHRFQTGRSTVFATTDEQHGAGTLDEILFRPYLSGMEDQTTSEGPTGLSEFQAKAGYRTARREFAAEVVRAQRVSRGAASIRSETAQH